MTVEPAASPEEATPQGRMKVFLSYAREDLDFAQELRLALEDKGFEVLIDIHGIDAGEKWKERLGALIAESDTVAFVLSKQSAVSPICVWEVEEAHRLAKRVLVVVPRSLPAGIGKPPQLADIQWIHCYKDPTVPGSSFVDGLLRLDRALRVDAKWLREQTRLGDRALEWHRSQDDARLLRGRALEEAQGWLGKIPPGAGIPHHVIEFIDKSDVAERERSSEAAAQIAAREEALRSAEQALREKQEAVIKMEEALHEAAATRQKNEALRSRYIEEAERGSNSLTSVIVTLAFSVLSISLFVAALNGLFHPSLSQSILEFLAWGSLVVGAMSASAALRLFRQRKRTAALFLLVKAGKIEEATAMLRSTKASSLL